MQVSHTNRLSHFVDLAELLQLILEKITANGANFAAGFLDAVAYGRRGTSAVFTSARRFAQRSGYS